MVLQIHLKLCVTELDVLEKKKNCPKNLENRPKNAPKQGFLNLLKNLVINIYWICSIMKTYIKKTTNQTLWPLFMDGVQLSQGYTATSRRQLSLPEIPGTHLIDLGRMTGSVDLGATQWFWTWDPWIENPAPEPLGAVFLHNSDIWENFCTWNIGQNVISQSDFRIC